MGQHNGYKKDEYECIHRKAYELWEKNGQQQGQDLHYWLDAERSVKGSVGIIPRKKDRV